VTPAYANLEALLSLQVLTACSERTTAATAMKRAIAVNSRRSARLSKSGPPGRNRSPRKLYANGKVCAALDQQLGNRQTIIVELRHRMKNGRLPADAGLID
jgi:hypothetical protein